MKQEIEYIAGGERILTNKSIYNHLLNIYMLLSLISHLRTRVKVDFASAVLSMSPW